MTRRFDDAQVHAALWPGPPPERTLACRHCGRKNEVSVADAALRPGRCECGACKRPLFLGPGQAFSGLASTAYAHPLDVRARATLESIPGAATLVRSKLAAVDERSVRLLCRATCIECGPTQHPDLAALLERARHSLGIDRPVTLFVGESPFLNASTAGVREPVVVLQSALVDTLEDPEILVVLGHELGHVHADHVTFLSLAELLARGLQLTDLGGIVTLPIQLALAKWSRCAELTCDRAALLATRDLGAVLSVFSVLAGGRGAGRSSRFDLAAWVLQARRLAEAQESSLVDGLFGALHSLDRSHPLVAWRLMHLVEWVEHGDYLPILAGDHGSTR